MKLFFVNNNYIFVDNQYLFSNNSHSWKNEGTLLDVDSYTLARGEFKNRNWRYTDKKHLNLLNVLRSN